MKATFGVVGERVITRWGYYYVLSPIIENVFSDMKVQIKELHIEPYKSISLQYHNHRAEFWNIVSGSGRFTEDGETWTDVSVSQTIIIPRGGVHKIEASEEGLIIEESWVGDELSEEDIVRLEKIDA